MLYEVITFHRSEQGVVLITRSMLQARARILAQEAEVQTDPA